MAASGWPVCGLCYESWAINCTVYSAGAQLPSSSHPESHWEEPVLLSAWDCHKHTRRRKKQTHLWTLTTPPGCTLTMYRDMGIVQWIFNKNFNKKKYYIEKALCLIKELCLIKYEFKESSAHTMTVCDSPTRPGCLKFLFLSLWFYFTFHRG